MLAVIDTAAHGKKRAKRVTEQSETMTETERREALDLIGEL